MDGPFADSLRSDRLGRPGADADHRLSLRVTLTAVLIACLIGLPLGAGLALARFPGRGGGDRLFNALMGLPPVVAGLLVYLLLSRSGPLGRWRCCSRPRR
jgi:tungstate transport system permease protein